MSTPGGAPAAAFRSRGGRDRSAALISRALVLLLFLSPAAPSAASFPEVQPAAALAGSGPPGGRPAGAAVSETLIFEDIPIVITASRHEQKVSDAPASVVVIGADEIERQGYRTLAEALQSVPGFYTSYDRNYTYIGVRGFSTPGDYNRRLQIQINGHPLNDNIWDYTGAGEDLGFEMAMTERIEVVYGPGSALYGSNALFATVNVITREAPPTGRGEAALEGGSSGRGQARLTYGGQAGPWKLAGSASGLRIGGDDLFYPEYEALGQNGGVTEGADFEKAYRLFGSAQRGNWSLQASNVYRTKGIPTGAYFTVFNDDASRTTDVRSFVELRYRRPLRPGLDIQVRAAYDEYRYRGTYRYDAGGGLLVDNIDRSTGRWLSQEAQLDWRLSERQRFTFGQGLVRNVDALMKNYDRNPYFLYQDTSERYGEYSVFGQHQLALGRAWQLTSGLRYDDYSSFGSALAPRFGLIYEPRPSWRMKLLGGRAFRAPNINELRFEDPSDALREEVVTSSELVVESRLDPRLDLRISVYEERMRDLIAASGAFYVNVEEARTRGAEVELKARFGNGLSGHLSYSYMDAEDGSGGRLVNYPPYAIKGGMSAPFGGDRWRLSANAQYYAPRLTLAGTGTRSALLANVTMLAPLFHRHARFSASVYNLFDRDYDLPASDAQQDLVLIPQDGRTVAARVLWSY